MVEIEDNGWGRLGVTRDAVVNQGPRETIKGFMGSLVFQPREGEHPGEVLLGVQRGPCHVEFAHGVAAEAMGVAPIYRPRRDLIEALGQESAQKRVNRGQMPLIMGRCSQARREPYLLVHPSQDTKGGDDALASTTLHGLATAVAPRCGKAPWARVSAQAQQSVI